MDHSLTVQTLMMTWVLPAFLSSVGAFLLGVIWYHPKALGTKWMEARGAGNIPASFSSAHFIVTFPLWFITALFFTFMVAYFGSSPVEIFLMACLLWVAFAMPPIVMGALYTGHPFNAVAIDAAYQLAGYYTIALVHILFKLYV
jgi:hypothetical protein